MSELETMQRLLKDKEAELRQADATLSQLKEQLPAMQEAKDQHEVSSALGKEHGLAGASKVLDGQLRRIKDETFRIESLRNQIRIIRDEKIAKIIKQEKANELAEVVNRLEIAINKYCMSGDAEGVRETVEPREQAESLLASLTPTASLPIIHKVSMPAQMADGTEAVEDIDAGMLLNKSGEFIRNYYLPKLNQILSSAKAVIAELLK